MFPALGSRDASSLPSRGSDHAPVLISLRPPSPYNHKPRPYWQEADWPCLTTKVRNWTSPPPLDNSSPNQLHRWIPSALCTLTTTIEPTAPRSRSSPMSKAWWNPLLTSLQKEFTKTTRRAKKLRTPDPRAIARQSRLGYCKAINRGKASYGAQFLAKPPRRTSGRLSS